MSQTMVYQCPGPHEIHGGRFDYKIVDDAEVSKAVDDGWSLTTSEAKEKSEKKEEKPVEVSDAPATRDELEQKAKELGIEFDGRTSDKKLGDKIEAALKG